jgi:nicotinamide mononucleotide transporter
VRVAYSAAEHLVLACRHCELRRVRHSVLADQALYRKKLESWYMWFAIDVLYVGIYIYKEVYLTAGLYVLFLGLAVAGLIEWKKTLNAPAAVSATA